MKMITKIIITKDIMPLLGDNRELLVLEKGDICTIDENTSYLDKGEFCNTILISNSLAQVFLELKEAEVKEILPCNI